MIRGMASHSSAVLPGLPLVMHPCSRVPVPENRLPLGGFFSPDAPLPATLAVPGAPPIFLITQCNRVWLLSPSFVISEGSGSAPGYSTCPVLKARPHGDWVMSLMYIRKGANQGLVFSMGKILPIFNFYSFASRPNRYHGIFLGEHRVTGLL